MENAPKELDPAAYKSALLQSLIAKQEVSDADLRDLARSRAGTVRNYLVNVGVLNAN